MIHIATHHVRRLPPPQVPDVPEAHISVKPPGDEELLITPNLCRAGGARDSNELEGLIFDLSNYQGRGQIPGSWPDTRAVARYQGRGQVRDRVGVVVQGVVGGPS